MKNRLAYVNIAFKVNRVNNMILKYQEVAEYAYIVMLSQSKLNI